MNDVRSVQSNAAIGEWLRQSGGAPEPLAVSALDEPIWLGKFGGTSGDPIVITAGSHADEVAGVYAALQLAQSIETEHPVYVIPARDPLGWNGFAGTLNRVVPGHDPVASYEQAAAMLRRGEVLHDDGMFVIARIGDLTFATEPDGKWTSTQITRHKLPAMLRENLELADALKHTRILVPGNVEVNDGRTAYSYGGHTAYIGDGFFAQLNRFFDREDSPVEVTALREFVDRVRPGLTIDMHEGFGKSYYLFLHGESSAETYNFAGVMIDAVRDAGFSISTRKELEPVWGPKTSAGILSKGEGIFAMGPPCADPHASFAGYCDQFGISITTESGMEADVDDRIRMIATGSRAVIDAFIQSRRVLS